jgi:gas vesicle structural protein
VTRGTQRHARPPTYPREARVATVTGGGYLARPAPSGLADVIEIVLDKGIVIDAYLRVSLVGIELLTVDARIVVASVDTYLRFAEATHRLDLHEKGGKGLPEIVQEGAGEVIEGVASHVAEEKVENAIDSAAEKVGEIAEKVTGAVTPGRD